MPGKTPQILLLIFAVCALILAFIVLWPYVPKSAGTVGIILPLIVATLVLFVVYCLRTYGGPKAEKVAVTVGIGLVLGFFIWVTIFLIYQFLMGPIPEGLSLLVVFGSYVVAFIAGAYVSKRIEYDS